MAHLIDKDVVVAELERLKNIQLSIFSKGETQESCYDSLTCISVYNTILSFLNTLEVEEVTSIELLKVKGFLVTDKDDYTAIYSTKPNRGRTEWVDGNHPRNANESSCLMTLNNARLLPDIEFNDKPIEVEVVIKAQKGWKIWKQGIVLNI